MWLIERLRALSPPILQCPLDAGEFLLYRVTRSESGIALGTSLTVRPDEHAMLVSERRVVDVLSPGIYRLDREQLAELDAMFTWPADFSGPVLADVLFVSTQPARRVVWQCRAGDDTLHEPFEASGTLDLTVTEPQRFAAWHLERGHDSDDAVKRAIEKAVATALRAHLASRAGDSHGAGGDPREIARQLRKRMRADMASRGIGEYSLRVRRLQRSAPRPARPPVEEKRESSNITHLSFDRSAVQVESAPPDPPSVRREEADEIDAIAELEREIERLDAWSGIGGGRPSQDTPEEPTGGETPGRRLPDHFHGLSFYIAVNMEQTGPFDAGEFEQALREGVVDDSTLVWFQGMEDWRPAREIPEIAALLRGSGA